MEQIEKRVHELYWNEDINCAGTMLTCLGEAFGVDIEAQVLQSAVGLHGAGGFRAQCGLVEGVLMFLGIYGGQMGRGETWTVSSCYRFAEAFENKFSSLRCFDLRPGGFSESDPPHLCEKLTCRAVAFACDFIRSLPPDKRD